jgi:hypothetical protein
VRLNLLHGKLIYYGIILALILALLYLTKIAFTPRHKLPAKIAASVPTSSQNVVDPCASFSTDTGEISCKDAKEIALSKYPGSLLGIQKTSLKYSPGKPPKIQTEERKVWLIRIKPNDISSLPSPAKTLDSIGVAVDRKTKTILFFQMYTK